MSGQNSNSKLLFQIADDFGDAWSDGSRPNIEEYLKRVSDDQVGQLLEMLIPEDIDRRIDIAEFPVAEDYQFPDAAFSDIAYRIAKTVLKDRANDDSDETATAPPRSKTASKERYIGPFKILKQFPPGGMGDEWHCRVKQGSSSRIGSIDTPEIF